jgi:translation initiation factor 2B subunit (eIF-2B alpha/beta/delta family)
MECMNKREKFNKILKDIKEVKIQGAKNVAKSALSAYYLFPNSKSKRILLSLRATEPMLSNVLAKANKQSKGSLLSHFDESQNKINKFVHKLIKNNDKIFTHCHSTTVVNALIYSKKHGKKFQVYNTETRPLFQGRKTATELKNAKIKTTTFVDSASFVAIAKENKKDKTYSTKVFLGADALLSKGVINKIGSGMIAKIAKDEKIPVYIIADSWKFTKKKVPIEERKASEVWNNAPKNTIIKNPAFEFIPRKYIKAIVSEKGILEYDKFLKFSS